MTVSQSALAWLYLYAALLGLCLGAFYDALRITRVFFGMHYSRRTARQLQQLPLPFLKPRIKSRESRALGLIIFFEDLFFCMVAGIALVLLFYEVNSGRFRFPALISAAAGFLFYRGTLGRLVMLFSEIIAFVIETAVRYLCFFISFPILTAARITGKQLRRFGRWVALQRTKRAAQRYTAEQMRRSLRDACGLLPVNMEKIEAQATAHREDSKKIKKGRTLKHGKAKESKEAVQPVSLHARPARRAGGGFARRFRNQRHEVQ